MSKYFLSPEDTRELTDACNIMDTEYKDDKKLSDATTAARCILIKYGLCWEDVIRTVAIGTIPLIEDQIMRRMLEEHDRGDIRMTEWEHEFLYDVHWYRTNRLLTPNQHAVFIKILRRYDEETYRQYRKELQPPEYS